MSEGIMVTELFLWVLLVHIAASDRLSFYCIFFITSCLPLCIVRGTSRCSCIQGYKRGNLTQQLFDWWDSFQGLYKYAVVLTLGNGVLHARRSVSGRGKSTGIISSITKTYLSEKHAERRSGGPRFLPNARRRHDSPEPLARCKTIFHFVQNDPPEIKQRPPTGEHRCNFCHVLPIMGKIGD